MSGSAGRGGPRRVGFAGAVVAAETVVGKAGRLGQHPAERGAEERPELDRRALVNFKILLANGGRGLDSRNWAALGSLCRAEGYGDLGD